MPIPILVPIAIGIGAAIWDAFQEKNSVPSAGLSGEYRDDGDGLHLQFTNCPISPDTLLFLHGRAPDGGYLRAANKFHADSDGDFVSGKALAGTTCSFYIPHGAILGGEGEKLRLSARRVQHGSDGSSPKLLSEDLLILDWRPQPYSPVAFFRPLLTVLKALAESDGSLVREEVRCIREFFTEVFSPTDAQLDELRLFLKAPRERMSDDLPGVLMYRLPSPDLSVIAGLLGDLAKADGDISTAEVRFFREQLPKLGMGQEQLAEFLKSLGVADERELEPYLSLLGLSGRPSFDELRRAWRRTIKDFHPDRYHGAELPPTVQAMIAAKSAEINAAYDALRKAYGYGEA